MATTRHIIRYMVEKSRAMTALGLSNVTDWGWNGNNLMTRHSEVITPDTPITHVDKGDTLLTYIPWTDIRDQFMPGVVTNKVQMTFDETNIYITLDD